MDVMVPGERGEIRDFLENKDQMENQSVLAQSVTKYNLLIIGQDSFHNQRKCFRYSVHFIFFDEILDQ